MKGNYIAPVSPVVPPWGVYVVNIYNCFVVHTYGTLSSALPKECTATQAKLCFASKPYLTAEQAILWAE